MTYLPCQCVFVQMLQVQKYWFPENEMKKRYPQIQGFFAISSFSGEVNEHIYSSKDRNR